jgi:hypothetical protein
VELVNPVFDIRDSRITICDGPGFDVIYDADKLPCISKPILFNTAVLEIED